MQFLITVLTLWQVGRSYIKKLQADAQIEAEKAAKKAAAKAAKKAANAKAQNP